MQRRIPLVVLFLLVGCGDDDVSQRDADTQRDSRTGSADRFLADVPELPPATPEEWTQHAHDAQHTGYTAQTVSSPWVFAWQWNGADEDGKTQDDHLDVPDDVQPITGGGLVYMVANDTVYALDRASGEAAWTRDDIGALRSTCAYLDGQLFVASGDGHLYRLDARNGTPSDNFEADGALDVAPMIFEDRVYVGSAEGTLYAVDAESMEEAWHYDAGSAIVTPPAISAEHDRIVIVTQDLYVHAIESENGAPAWRVKPTPRTYESDDPSHSGAQAERGWPVVADGHGIVFVRYRLDWDSLWASNPFPNTVADVRAFLEKNADQQALYALDLEDGDVAFVPAVGNGGAGDGGYLPMGPQPVIRVVDGREVAYIIWRNSQTCGGCESAGDCGGQWCDGREDATMGEMVLDAGTVAGYAPGDVRFIAYTDIQTDEMMNISMSGDVLFHSHWLVNEAHRIVDRGAARGDMFENPITTEPAPFVIWRQCYCPESEPNCNPIIYPGGEGFTSCPSDCPFDAKTRYCESGLYSYGDQRGYPGGFYEYHNDNNGGSTPYAIVSDGRVIVKTEDGALFALRNGNAQPTLRIMGAPIGTASIALRRPVTIPFTQALAHVGEVVTTTGTIASVRDRRPKALYLGFRDPHDGALLVRIFEKDVHRFPYDPRSLLGTRVHVTGRVTLYWPENDDPEIIVTDPRQIVRIENGRRKRASENATP